MPTPTILVVVRTTRRRREIADLLVEAGYVVFCACDSIEVIDYEVAGLRWDTLVFAGRDAPNDVSRYLRSSTIRAPIVMVGGAGLTRPHRTTEGALATPHALVLEAVDRALFETLFDFTGTPLALGRAEP